MMFVISSLPIFLELLIIGSTTGYVNLYHWQLSQLAESQNVGTQHARDVAMKYLACLYEGGGVDGNNPYSDSVRQFYSFPDIEGQLPPNDGPVAVIDTYYIQKIFSDKKNGGYKIEVKYSQLMKVDNSLQIIEGRRVISVSFNMRNSKVTIPPKFMFTGRSGAIWWLNDLMRDKRQREKAKQILIKLQQR